MDRLLQADLQRMRPDTVDDAWDTSSLDDELREQAEIERV